MKIRFRKMHGAGNDFIVIDDRGAVFPASDGAWIARMCARRTGIGSDGLMLVRKSRKADFRMTFFNPDGSEAEMCGNGARCIARFAREIGAAGARMTVETVAGILRAECEGELVRLHMTDPKDWRMDRRLRIGGRSLPYSFVNTGVPHVVVAVRDIDRTDVRKTGAAIRRHRVFAPAGTNANFMEVTGRNSIRIRTYERGVEGETLACGTGMVASALTAGRQGRVTPPVSVTCASGDVLEVDYTARDDGAEGVTLLGPAVTVFDGVVAYDAPRVARRRA